MKLFIAALAVIILIVVVNLANQATQFLGAISAL